MMEQECGHTGVQAEQTQASLLERKATSALRGRVMCGLELLHRGKASRWQA